MDLGWVNVTKMRFRRVSHTFKNYLIILFFFQKLHLLPMVKNKKLHNNLFFFSFLKNDYFLKVINRMNYNYN